MWGQKGEGDLESHPIPFETRPFAISNREVASTPDQSKL